MLLVATGLTLAKTGLISATYWKSVENFSFRVLIPALIVQSIYTSDLSLKSSRAYGAALLRTMGGNGALTLL